MSNSDESDRITFRCQVCDATLAVDSANPPAEDEMLHCNGCGRAIAKFGEVKRALIQAGKDHLEKLVGDAFGKPIKLDWKNSSEKD